MFKLNTIRTYIAVFVLITLLSALCNTAYTETKVIPQKDSNIVKISQKGGVYDHKLNITFTITKGFSVYYTTDNSIPTVKKLKYVKPIQISQSTTLRYIYVDKKGVASKVFTESYKIKIKPAPKPAPTQEPVPIPEPKPAADFWTFKKSMPVTINDGSFTMSKGEGLKWTEHSNAMGKAVTIGSKIYIISTEGQVQEYDPTTDTWTQKADVSSLKDSNGFFKLVGINNLIFVIGNSNNEIQQYDPSTNECKSIGKLPSDRVVGSAVAANGKVYILGGIDKSKVNTLDTVDEYNPVTNVWTSKKNMFKPINRLSATTLNGKVYILGMTEDFKTQIQEYNPETDQWTSKAALSRMVMGAQLETVNDKLYIITDGNLIEEYDPSTDKLTTMTASLEIQTRSFATAVANGKIYAIGDSGTVAEYCLPNP